MIAGGARGPYARWGKRAVDLAGVALVAPLVVPVIALSALCVRATSAGPAFFTQERLGRGGRAFRLYKLRTMTHVARSTHVEVLAGNAEVTAVGAVLRRLKLDELPQLLNVLRGDMSWIGPRPALPAQWHEADPRARERLAVRPGLTGLAQVSGNIHLTWPERWSLDVEYCRRVSARLDAWIALRTLAVLALGEARFAPRPAPSAPSSPSAPRNPRALS